MDRILVRAVTALGAAIEGRTALRASGERGATATEYAVVLGCIFLAVVVAAGWFGQRVGGVMSSDHLGFPMGS